MTPPLAVLGSHERPAVCHDHDLKGVASNDVGNAIENRIVSHIRLLPQNNWRRERDSNPRGGISAYTISNRAPSTTRTSLRDKVGHRVPRSTGPHEVPGCPYG